MSWQRAQQHNLLRGINVIGFELGPDQAAAPVPPLHDFFSKGAGQRVAITQGAAGALTIWTEIAENYAACLRLDLADPTNRYSWRESVVTELRNIYTVADLQLTGSWSHLQSSGSGLQSSYTGNRCISTSSTSALAAVTVGRSTPYDLWIHYTGRTSGSYCRVDIDGDQSLVNEITDPGALGCKAFSTYCDVDMTRRQSIKVASGLTGNHQITIRNAGASVPGGAALLVEAVGISGALDDPRILPPPWSAGQGYVIGDEVQHGGIFYAARQTGTSGANAPTHAAGIASDGALDWRADNRSTYHNFVAIDYPSEREYAAQFTVAGNLTELGGQTHGNEVLVARSILIDGTPWVPVANTLSVGSAIVITENTTWRRAEGGDIGECQLQRRVQAGEIRHDVNVIGTGATADMQWLYVGMVPLVRWDGETATPVFDTINLATGTAIALADYSGAIPANLSFNGVRRFALGGVIGARQINYGHEAGVSGISQNSLNQFDTILRPNLDAAIDGGGLDWMAKGYVSAGEFQFGAGDALGFFNRHVLRVP